MAYEPGPKKKFCNSNPSKTEQRNLKETVTLTLQQAPMYMDREA